MWSRHFAHPTLTEKKPLEIFLTITGYFKLDRPIFFQLNRNLTTDPHYMYLRILNVILF